MPVILMPDGGIAEWNIITKEEYEKTITGELPLEKLSSGQDRKVIDDYYRSINVSLQEFYEPGHHMDIPGFPKYAPRTEEQNNQAKNKVYNLKQEQPNKAKNKKSAYFKEDIEHIEQMHKLLFPPML